LGAGGLAIVLGATLAVLGGCASSTRLSRPWSAPGEGAAGVRQLAVAHVAGTGAERRAFEERVAAAR